MKKQEKIILVDTLIVIAYLAGLYPVETLPTVLLVLKIGFNAYTAGLMLFIILSLHVGLETYLLGWRFDQTTDNSFGRKFIKLIKNGRLFQTVYEDAHRKHFSWSLMIIYLCSVTPYCLKFATFICATSKNKYAIIAMYLGILTKAILCSWLGASYFLQLIHNTAAKFS